MKKTAKKTVEKVIEQSGYFATAIIAGKRYTAEGDTAKEAIDKLQPGIVKTKTILAVTHGDTSKERVLMPLLSSRLFNTRGLSREISLKNVSMMFDGL
jgi:hypothetical protein